MERTKILHIAQADGGVERYIKLFVEHSDPQQYEHILIGSQLYQKKRYGRCIVEIVPMERSIRIIHDIKAIVQLRRSIKRHQPDIVFLHSSKAGALGRIAGYRLPCKIIYNPHGWAFQMHVANSKRYIYQKIEQFLSHFCDAVIVISKCEEEAALKRHICKKEKLHMIYNGIALSLPHHVKQRKELGIPEDAFVIGCTARIAYGKSPLLFVKAAQMIKKHINNAYFLWIGDGPMREEMEQAIQQTGLTSCFGITGWVDDTLPYVAVFDVGVLLTRWEGFGYAICEYMLMKKAVIATNVDSMPELVRNQKSGLLIEPDNPSALLTAIEQMRDLKIRRKYIDQAYEILISMFTIEQTSEKLLLLIQDVKAS